MENPLPFWLVWNPNGYPPRYQHTTQESAEREAERLARENPGQDFYVLTPVMKARKNDVLIERYRTDDVPF